MRTTIRCTFCLILLMSVVLVTSCNKDDNTYPLTVFEHPTFKVSVSEDTVPWKGTVTFIDSSTKVHSRSWVFQPGPTVNQINDSTVQLTYPWGGRFAYKASITFIDNTVQTRQDSITVLGPLQPKDPVITGLSYNIYSEHPNITAGKSIAFQASNQFVAKNIVGFGNTFHGNAAQSWVVDGTGVGAKTFAFGILIFVAAPGSTTLTQDNLSAFADGYLNVAIRSKSSGNIRIRIRNAAGTLNDWKTLTAAGAEYGFKRDGNWHQLSIPIVDIFALNHSTLTSAQRAALLTAVREPFDIRSDDVVDITATPGGFNFDLDDIFYSVNKPKY